MWSCSKGTGVNASGSSFSGSAGGKGIGVVNNSYRCGSSGYSSASMMGNSGNHIITADGGTILGTIVGDRSASATATSLHQLMNAQLLSGCQLQATPDKELFHAAPYKYIINQGDPAALIALKSHYNHVSSQIWDGQVPSTPGSVALLYGSHKIAQAGVETFCKNHFGL